jgi:diacylglycerol kinase family enzyme
LDGKVTEVQGLTCLVDNAGNMGISNLSPGRNIGVSDGLLDVLLIINPGFGSLVDASKKLVERGATDSYFHWQAKDITIEADPPQPVQIDGEMAGETPVYIRVIPQALGVLVAGNPV